MTDKEKEAIRVLNEDLKLAKEEDSIDIDVLTGNLEIALNLIEKQQAEIEDWKTDYNHRCQLAIDRKIELEKKDRQLEERTNRIRNLERECQKYFDNIMEVIQENSNKDKIINKIQEEVLDHIGFENRLKKDNREPDLFNQGRFYVANNINDILKGK